MSDQPPQKRSREEGLTEEEGEEYTVIQGMIRKEMEETLSLDAIQIRAVCKHHNLPEDLSAVELADALIRKGRGEHFTEELSVSILLIFF